MAKKKKLAFDKEEIRKRYVDAVSTLIGNGISKMYKTNEEYCDAAGHRATLLANIVKGRNNVSIKVLHGLILASDGEVSANEIIFGDNPIVKENGGFTFLPKNHILINKDNISKIRSLLEFTYKELKDIEGL